MMTRPTRWFGAWGSPHLSEESLVELHTLLVTGEHALAARYLRHVRQCDDCTARLDALRDDYADLRSDVVAAADARITSSRLDRQFDVISRRLQGQSGRVLPFPATVHRAMPQPSLHRWVAVAAACGLLIGVGAGRLMDTLDADDTTWRPASLSGTAYPGRATIQQETDEEMLVEIDAAITRSRAREFRALDELTPRVTNPVPRSGR